MATTPDQLFAALDALGIPHKTVKHPPVFTVEQAKKLLMKAAEMANESGKHAITMKMISRAAAYSMRQCCYAAQRSFINQTVRLAEADGISAETALRQTLLEGKKGEFVDAAPAVWPSASILYRHIKGEHLLVILFRRIGTDPLWSDMIEENMKPGAPEEVNATAEELANDI